jgi:hypothetical protein
MMDFTDGGFWTPQTFMLQAIHSWISACSAHPTDALSIDRNRTLEGILCSNGGGKGT